MTALLESFSLAIAAKPQSEQNSAIQDAVNSLPNDQKKVMVEALGLLPINNDTSNRIWLIIICAFAFAMIATVVVLGVGVFFSSSEKGVKPDMILTIFTTTAAFLAGLFAPSLVAKNNGG